MAYRACCDPPLDILPQFLSHLDMEMLFQNVPTLSHLDMTHGVKEIGMAYERALFGMKMNDVTSLANALKVIVGQCAIEGCA